MASQELPSDMIFEILSRTTSLKTLDICKCVSKQWKQEIIDDSNFMSVYYKRTNNLRGVFLYKQTRNRKPVLVSIDHLPPSSVGREIPRGIRILASCDQGILLCRGNTIKYPCNYRYYVGKPSTRQWQALPNPKLRYKTVGEAMAVLGSSPLRFKILRISIKVFTEAFEHLEYRCEMFNSEVWSWREIRNPRLPSSEYMQFRSPPVFVKGSFHWLTTGNNILSFHEAAESFGTFPSPEPIMVDDDYFYRDNRIIDYQGRLGLSCSTGDEKVELWVWEGEWKKHMVVDYGRLEENPVKNEIYSISFYNGGILLLRTYNKVVFYRIEDDSFSEVELDRESWYALQMLPFRSDFERVCFR